MRDGRAALTKVALALAAPWLLFPTLLPALTVLALLLLLGSGWVAARREAGGYWPVSPFNPALLLWSVMVLVGILVSDVPALTLPKALGLLFGLLLWRELVVTVRSPARLRLALALFLLLGAGLVLLGALSADWQREIPLFQQEGLPFPAQWLALPGNDGVHMNQLAGVLAFFLSLLLPLWLAVGPLRGRGVLLFLALLGLAGLLLLSQSRGGWLGALAGVGVGAGVWGWAQPRGARWRWLPAGLAGAGLLLLLTSIWLVGPQTIRQVSQELPPQTALGSFSTFQFRLNLWPWAITAIRDAPLSGVGLGAFRVVLFRDYQPTALDPTFDVAHAHNIFLQVALDTGLPGLLAYLGLLALAVVVGWQALRRNPALIPPVSGLWAGLAALHVYGLLDAIAPGAKPGWIFWYALGLLAALPHLDEAAADDL